MYDVVIVGGGIAGLTAAIYTRRKKMKTLIVSMDVGGQTLLTDKMENYPGFTGGPGGKLMETAHKQAEDFGTEFVSGKVNKIEKKKKGEGFVVKTTNGDEFEGKTAILATGKQPRSLGIPGEDKFMGKGVSTCVTCDAPLFADKKVAVIGGGNSAFEGAELLNKYASKVYLIHRRQGFRADEMLVDRVKKMDKVELVLDTVLKEIKGDKMVESIVVENTKTEKKKEIEVDGVFIEIGYELKTDFLKGFLKRNHWGEIMVDKHCRTSQKGVFAAGDVTNVPYKQTIVAAGEGAKAGLSAYNYLQKKQGKKGTVIDW